MKYQQLENLESGWKWKYLVKKHREGELITRYVEASAAKEAVDLLLTVQLIEDAEHKEKYANKMSTLKQDLQALLGKE